MYHNDKTESITPPSDSDNNMKKEETPDLFNTTSYGNGALDNLESGHDAVFGDVGEGDTNYRNVHTPGKLATNLNAINKTNGSTICRSAGSEQLPS